MRIAHCFLSSSNRSIIYNYFLSWFFLKSPSWGEKWCFTVVLGLSVLTMYEYEANLNFSIFTIYLKRKNKLIMNTVQNFFKSYE